MKRSSYRILHLLLVVALLLTFAAPAFAEGGPGPDKANPYPDLPKAGDKWIQNLEAKQAYEDAIQKMEPHLYLGIDGQLHLDVDSGQAIGVPDDIFQELSSGLAIANAHIQAGDLQIEDIALSNGMNMLGQRAPVYSVSPETMSALGVTCAGWTGIAYNWYGPRYYLDDCKAQALAGVLGGAAGAVAFFSGLGFNIPADVVGGLLAMGGGAIWAIDAWGGFQGIYVQTSWYGTLGWVWHQ